MNAHHESAPTNGLPPLETQSIRGLHGIVTSIAYSPASIFHQANARETKKQKHTAYLEVQDTYYRIVTRVITPISGLYVP